MEIKFPSLKRKFDRNISGKGDPKIRTKKDLSMYFRFTTKLFDNNISYIHLLIDRIIKFYLNQGKRRNLRQVFTYLKEVYTLNNSLLVNGNYEPKVRISRDTNMRPKLLPPKLRNIYLQDRKLFVLTQTILCVHRLIK